MSMKDRMFADAVNSNVRKEQEASDERDVQILGGKRKTALKLLRSVDEIGKILLHAKGNNISLKEAIDLIERIRVEQEKAYALAIGLEWNL